MSPAPCYCARVFRRPGHSPRVDQSQERAVAFAEWLFVNRSGLSDATRDLERIARTRAIGLTDTYAGAPAPLREAAAEVGRIVAAAEAYVPTAHSASALRQYLVALRALRSQADVLVGACSHGDPDVIVGALQVIAAVDAACTDLQQRTRGANLKLPGLRDVQRAPSFSSMSAESGSVNSRVAS
jgi:hypothetical protein